LQAVLSRREYEGDLVLCSMARTQQIFEQILHSPYAVRFTGLNFDSYVEEAEAPPQAFVKALEAQQQAIERDLPPDLRTSRE
jgi:hypothetical protein